MERTLKWLREDPSCLKATKVEHWNPHARKRIDLFGGDVIALYPDSILLIQVTDMDHRSAHVKKSKASSEVCNWIMAGGAFEIWAWRKLKAGWAVDRTAITPFDFGLPKKKLVVYEQPKTKE
jgi:hypothetical protein